MTLDVKYVVRSALENEHESWFPIEDFTIESLNKLAEEAKKNNVDIRIIAEHSHYFNGTVIEVQKNKSGQPPQEEI